MKMIEIKNLSISAPEKNIINNISFDINSNEILALIGSSGSGKSQIARAIKGISKLKLNGTINYGNISNIEIGYIFQDFAECLNPVLKIKEQIIEASIYHKKLSKKDAIIKAKKVLKDLNLDENVLEKYPFELSGGQKQRIVIGICLMMEPKLLICDEITTGLDNINEYEILELVSNLNISVLLITHNINAVRKFSDRIIFVNNKEIIKVKTVEDLKKYSNIEYINAMNRMLEDEFN
ncbi:ATP-binding cassette domain-containing protein [Streptobacillus moniliformis]|uniref:ABC transporter related protein n=1 Tax=Streptobacillus moniliformis (strain ATCC 14647 / DSM 12112 / NCTC 10651 / 9901) TaxID=519441 RepID=D1AYL5_STRM9|nr:ATP-binding cassette domain-containing protein [Streptobacillus moniliformis]ACZ01391.1 ABC transporter related protein [Streptobacillus moniliformis DSM 12112]AVL43596.1 ABC transporter ATP-binding protein [Streptobacillus moniliformis]SQA13449.1 Glutathione import ATP-binding protein GsiA [Streptobacillus moniliformis]